MKFVSNIHGHLEMNPFDFGGAMSFLLVTPAGQSFHLSWEVAQHLLDGYATFL